jgi:hypothetical protein
MATGGGGCVRCACAAVLCLGEGDGRGSTFVRRADDRWVARGGLLAGPWAMSCEFGIWAGLVNSFGKFRILNSVNSDPKR